MSGKEERNKTVNIGPVPAAARDGIRRISYDENRAVGEILIEAARQVMAHSMPIDGPNRLDATAALDTLADGVCSLREALEGKPSSKPAKTRITFTTTPTAQREVGAAADERGLSIGHFLMQAALSLNNVGLPEGSDQASEAAQILDEITGRIDRLRQLLSVDPED